MTWPRALVLILFSAVTVGLLVSLPRFARPYTGPAAWDGAVQFSGERAWADVVTLATRFPRRWSGGPDRQAAADWLADGLKTMGLEVHRETFAGWVGESHPVTLENVWAVSPGTDRRDEIIVLAGNYDMVPTSVQAASDTAGHVGTILELARLLSAAPHRRTLVVVFPDGEEWGMLGARRFVRTFPQRARIVAAISIEDLDAGVLAALGIDGIGQFRGFAPMWLRALAADAAAREGYRTDEVSALFEWIQRSLLVSSTDQGPFLERGIPAIDLAGRADDAALKARVYHLPDDTIEHMRPGSVLAYGRIQERIVRALDAMPAVPRESSVYLRLGPERVVPFGWLLVIQVLAFAPLAAAVLFRVRQGALRGMSVIRELVRVGIVLVVLLLWVDVVKLLPFLGLLPRYSLYAPPPRHPLLTTVAWPPVLVSAAVLVAAALLAGRFLRPLRDPAGVRSTTLVSTLLVCLAALVVVALAHNPFGAVTFLLLPALLWIWIRPHASLIGRIINAGLVGLAFIVVVLLFMQFAVSLRLGRHIVWYVFLAIAYAQFTLPQIVLSFATLAVAIRLLAVSALRGSSTP